MKAFLILCLETAAVVVVITIIYGCIRTITQKRPKHKDELDTRP